MVPLTMPGSRALFALLLLVAVSLPSVVAAAPSAAAVSPDDPGRAVVFIRVVGDLEARSPREAELLKAGGIETSNVELATGTGFLVSSSGYLLTCAHVVDLDTATVKIGNLKVPVQVHPRRYEVLFPEAAASKRGISAGPYEASLVASDPGLDVSVLLVGGGDLPYLSLGDSDAVETGDPVLAAGFPFGRDVDIGRTTHEAGAAPEISLVSGSFSAVRADGNGARHWLQVTAVANPGNSGGPLVDGDGFVVGVVSRVLMEKGAPTGITFAVSINMVKEFLESRGLDGQLNVRRYALDVPQALERKGLRVRWLQGMSDGETRRTRVVTPPLTPGELTFRVDRVVSPWPAARLAPAAIEAFDLAGVDPAQIEWRPSRIARREGVSTGLAVATGRDGRRLRVEYAVWDLGAERVVARYIGTQDAVAYNSSLLRASLASLDVLSLVKPWPGGVPAVRWSQQPSAASNGAMLVPVPQEWIAESGSPLACEGVSLLQPGVVASPARDYSIELRVAALAPGSPPVESAARSCGPGIDGVPASYSRRVEWLGVTYVIEGRFVDVGGRRTQIEAVGPAPYENWLTSLVTQAATRLVGGSRSGQ